MKEDCNSEFFTIVIDRDVMWKYFTYYKLNHSKARTFPFAKKITDKLFNKDGSPQLTKGGKQKTKSRNRKLSEITKDDMLYSVLSLNNLLPIDSMKYKSTKEKWGDLGKFLAKINGLENKMYQNAVVEFRIYNETKTRKDCDNYSAKILNDGLFSQSKMFEDDSYFYINPFVVGVEYLKEYPHTEIRISIIDEKIKDIYEKMLIHIDNFSE